MVGEAKSLVIEEELPEGVRLRRITEEKDIQVFSVMVDKSYGLNRAEQYAPRLKGLIAENRGVEIWAAEADGTIIGGGRVDPVPGTDFAGLWTGGMPPRMARAGHLSCIKVCSCAFCLGDGQDLDSVRLLCLLPAHSGKVGVGENLRNHAALVAAVLAISGKTCFCKSSGA